MIRGRSRLPYAHYLQEFFDQSRLKVLALVRMDTRRQSIMDKVLFDEDLCDCKGLLIFGREGLGVPCEMVCYDQHITYSF